MKRLFYLFTASAIVFSCSGAANADAAIIDINAASNAFSQYNYTNPISLALSAGTYTITEVGVAGGGVYDAWNAWGPSQSKWLNGYRVESVDITSFSVNNVPVSTSLVYGFSLYKAGSGFIYSNPLDALAAAPMVTFTMGASGVVNFGIADYPVTDNIGGISLLVDPVNNSLNNSPVPEPSTMLLLGSGIAGLVAIRRFRRA